MKVLVVDDHPLIRQALREVLRQINRSVQVLEAVDAPGALSAAEANPELKLILLDLALPGAKGLELLAELRARHPAIVVVVVSASDDRGLVERAIAQGAAGFIPKNSGHEIVVGALRLVLLGGIYVPPHVLAQGNGEAVLPESGPSHLAPDTRPEDLGLTARQVEVLRLMLRGKPNKLIARELGIAEATVKAHVTAVLRALKVMSRTQAVIQVGRLGWRMETPLAGG